MSISEHVLLCCRIWQNSRLAKVTFGKNSFSESSVLRNFCSASTPPTNFPAVKSLSVKTPVMEAENTTYKISKFFFFRDRL